MICQLGNWMNSLTGEIWTGKPLCFSSAGKMTNENSQIKALRRTGSGKFRPERWGLAALCLAALVVAPIVSVIWIAFHPVENIWPHLIATVLPRYLGNTLILMAGVGAITAFFGTGSAWLVTNYAFPGRRWLDVGLLFPLAIPAYVGAYALVDFLNYAGLVQTGLRAAMGWTSAQDYWFPEVRTRTGAVIVLSAALCPYVYFLARTAFRDQSGAAHDVARALGCGPWRLFWRVGVPLARPAIAAGVALALMETVADYGTVAHFGVQTLTTGIFTTWLTAGNAGGAAQIALLVLALILILIGLERRGRRGIRHHSLSRADRPMSRAPLGGLKGWVAFAFCVLPFVVGFVLPIGVMLRQAVIHPGGWLSPGLGQALLNTLIVSGAAAALTVSGALILVYGTRLSGRALPRLLLPVATLGYAAPGAVLALGLLIPLAAFDHRLADAVLAITGHDPGLILTGTSAALILAFAVRFFGVAQGAVDAGVGRIAPNLPLAARTLGLSTGGTLGAVYLPLLRGSLATALLVVFVDCVKELPATLLLRPFNFNTLATRVYEEASLERLSDAAPAALLVIAVGLFAVILLARTQSR
jgi:iron(III) transport system permease protein